MTTNPLEIFYVVMKDSVLFYDIDMKDCKMPVNSYDLIFLDNTRTVFFHNKEDAQFVADQWDKGQVRSCEIVV